MTALDCVLTALQVRSFIDGAYQRTLALLKENKELVEKMAQVRPGLTCYGRPGTGVSPHTVRVPVTIGRPGVLHVTAPSPRHAMPALPAPDRVTPLQPCSHSHNAMLYRVLVSFMLQRAFLSTFACVICFRGLFC
jgi:hypothetical protein